MSNRKEIEMIEKLLPKVMNSKLELVRFKHELIIESLLLETDISREEAIRVTLDVVRRLVGSNLKILTAPLIRELTCSSLLLTDMELYRFQYTRLGFPYFDYGKMRASGLVSAGKILEQLEKEYVEVSKIIENS